MAALRHAFPSHASLPTYARTAGRAVHITVRPCPSNISENRKILSALRQYGDVVMFQHLKYDPSKIAANTILAIYSQHTEAERLILASPVTLEISRDSWRQLAGNTNGKSPSSDEHRRHRPTSAKEFQLRIETSTLNHQAQIQRQYYYSYFEPDTGNVMSSDLVRRVPVPGMADCQIERAEVPFRLRAKRLKKEQVEKRGQWRESLSSLWERGREERTTRETDLEGTE